ncbi:hypothetical protein SAMN02744784_02573 [Stenotrophomonas sp. CC120223-11]|nr:hypothetical protein SAMN02744784_02573 [Stenotrophomonas sp. CC120223-11]
MPYPASRIRRADWRRLSINPAMAESLPVASRQYMPSAPADPIDKGSRAICFRRTK